MARHFEMGGRSLLRIGSRRGNGVGDNRTSLLKGHRRMTDIPSVNESTNGKRFGQTSPKSATAQLKGVRVGRKVVSVGLDIGSSAVRAAEVTGEAGNRR